MEQSRPSLDRAGRFKPRAVGQLAIGVGLAVVATTVPVVAGITAGFLADAASLGVAVSVVLSAMTGPLGDQAGTVWLFHAAVLALAGGCWLVGAGLVLEGLFD